MDLEALQFRSRIIHQIREFFLNRGYLEVDTPALSEHLIPENCLEVFQTEYIEPWSQNKKTLYLVPSPEVHIKPLIAKHKVSMFQLSKCYRNVESIGRIHNPEFTMLEYYTMDADYMDSATITEELVDYLLPTSTNREADVFNFLRPPFIRLSMDDAFETYAGFRLSKCSSALDLAKQALRLGIMEQPNNPFKTWAWDDLYELIFVQCVEPNLPKEKPVFLFNYPAKVPCLAKDVPEKNGEILWKQRWELYAEGIELSNCYSEETDAEKVRTYFESERAIKDKMALVPHKVDSEYWKHFINFPKCSGNAMGVDRLIALLSGYKTIEPILP